MSQLFGFSLWWTGLPIAVSIGIAARLHLPDWMVDRGNLRSRIRQFGPPVGTIFAILLLVPPARVFQIPGVDGPGFSAQEFLEAGIEENADDELIQALERIEELTASPVILKVISYDEYHRYLDSDPLLNEPRRVSGLLDGYVVKHLSLEEASAAHVDLPQEGLLRESFEADGLYVVQAYSDSALTEVLRLLDKISAPESTVRPVDEETLTLLYDTSLRLASEDRWEESLDALIAVIRAPYIPLYREGQFSYVRVQAHRMLREYARKHGRTEANWSRRAIQLLTDAGPRLVEDMRIVRKSWYLSESVVLLDSYENKDFQASMTQFLLPWEKTRYRRAIDCGVRQHLDACDAMLRFIENSDDLDSFQEFNASVATLEDLEERLAHPILPCEQEYQYVLHSDLDRLRVCSQWERERQESLGVLALVAYMAEHDGKTPDSFASLTGDYLEHVPRDLLTGAAYPVDVFFTVWIEPLER